MKLKIREYRKKAGLSQKELSDILNINHSTISKWETNKAFPRLEVILRLCKILKCSLDDLTKE